MNKTNRILIFFWFVISWGLIVIAKFDPLFNQLVLKFVIPFSFLVIIIMERKRVILTPPLFAYIIFSIWGTFSIFYTMNMELTLKYLQQMLGNILIWYVVFRLTHYIQNKKLFFLILGSAFFLHALFGFFRPAEINEIVGYARSTGIYTNANELGFAMWYGLVITLFFLTSSRAFFYRLIFLSIVFFLIWVLLSTGSRKSGIAVVISIGVYFYFTSTKNFKRFIVIVPVVILFIAFYNVFLQDLILNTTALGARLESDTLARGTFIRSTLIEEGIQFFMSHPFIGVGLGSFTYYSSTGLMAHNDYIEILSSMGIIGLLLYLPIFVFFYKQNKLLIRVKETYNYAVICLVFLAGYLFLGMGRPAFLDPVAILVFASFQGYMQRDLTLIKTEIAETYLEVQKNG